MSSKNKLSCKEDRLKSFEKWEVQYMDINRMAEAGFVYSQVDIFVQCVFGKLLIGTFEKHRHWSPLCPKLYTGKEDPEQKYIISLLPKQQPFYYPEHHRHLKSVMSTCALIEYPPAYPQFVSKTVRMASY
ncbi:hypothetical protein PR048_012581 [Dryococelus australis]|uniref:Uncharacterized protein n=1 Tax=Dryococelus australis TaxID=614101 RepID=A0ABQ9HQ19_9NEOP|nr:hypothetical protein PR048_012581 [Dryococelus australis]